MTSRPDLAFIADTVTILKPLDLFRENLLGPFSHTLEMIYMPARELGAIVGVEETVAMWLITMILTFISSLGLSLIRNTFCRKVYSTTFGLIGGFYLNGFAYIFIIITFMLVYLTMVLLPRKQAVIAGNLVALACLTFGNLCDVLTGIGMLRNTFVTWKY